MKSSEAPDAKSAASVVSSNLEDVEGANHQIIVIQCYIYKCTSLCCLDWGSQKFRKQPRLASFKNLEDSIEDVQSGCIFFYVYHPKNTCFQAED